MLSALTYINLLWPVNAKENSESIRRSVSHCITLTLIKPFPPKLLNTHQNSTAYHDKWDQACNDGHRRHNPLDTVRIGDHQPCPGTHSRGSKVKGYSDMSPSVGLWKHYKWHTIVLWRLITLSLRWMLRLFAVTGHKEGQGKVRLEYNFDVKRVFIQFHSNYCYRYWRLSLEHLWCHTPLINIDIAASRFSLQKYIDNDT